MNLRILVLALIATRSNATVRPSPPLLHLDNDEADVPEVDVAPELAQDLPPIEPRATHPLTVIAEEATALAQDTVDAISRGELFLGPFNDGGNGNEKLGPIDPFGDVVNAGVGLAKAGGQLAQGALHLQSKLGAPFVSLGAKLSAPVVKFKSKFVAPLVFVGAKLTKPLAKDAVKLAAPAIKVHQLAAKNLKPFTDHFVEGLTEALDPIRKAALPLEHAVLPIIEAVDLGFGDLDVTQEVAEVDIEGDIERLATDAGILTEEALLLKAAGARVAGQAVQDAVQGVRRVLNRRKRESYEGGTNYLQQYEPLVEEYHFYG